MPNRRVVNDLRSPDTFDTRLGKRRVLMSNPVIVIVIIIYLFLNKVCIITTEIKKKIIILVIIIIIIIIKLFVCYILEKLNKIIIILENLSKICAEKLRCTWKQEKLLLSASASNSEMILFSFTLLAFRKAITLLVDSSNLTLTIRNNKTLISFVKKCFPINYSFTHETST